MLKVAPLVALVVGLLPLWPSTAASGAVTTPSYGVLHLRTGHEFPSLAFGVNDREEVVGRGTGGPTFTDNAFVYTPARGAVGLAGIDEASAVNERGEVVGVHAGHAVSYTPRGGTVDLGTLPGGRYSDARAVNYGGEVAGNAETRGRHYHAFAYTPSGGMIDLGTLPHATDSGAYGVNDLGEVVGDSSNRRFDHAFRYTRSRGMVDLGTLPGGSGSVARKVSDTGEIVGYSVTRRGHVHAISYTPRRGMVDLGTLPGDTDSDAFGVNDLGEIVGDSSAGYGPPRAFIYIPGIGMIGLDAPSSTAWAVTNNGLVVGVSEVAGDQPQAVLWGPSDPPIVAAPHSVRLLDGKARRVVVAVFTDSDASARASDYSATIHWGDGKSSTGTLTGGKGTFEVAGRHVYARARAYTVTTTINDVSDSPGGDVCHSTASVARVPPRS